MELQEYNFQLRYRPGCEAAAPDALSRREQDIPAGEDDPRTLGRFREIFPRGSLLESPLIRILGSIEDASPSLLVKGTNIFSANKALAKL